VNDLRHGLTVARSQQTRPSNETVHGLSLDGLSLDGLSLDGSLSLDGLGRPGLCTVSCWTVSRWTVLSCWTVLYTLPGFFSLENLVGRCRWTVSLDGLVGR
jgi:hypothetical protein